MHVPRLCVHKARGHAYVTDPRSGKQILMGVAGSRAAEAAYRRWVREYLQSVEAVATPTPGGTVAQLALDYLGWASGYYRKEGEPTSEYGLLKMALDTAVKLFGSTPAADFTPERFLSCRQVWVDGGCTRFTANVQARRLRRVWKWAVERELVPPSTLVGLQAIAPLKRGRTPAPDREKVRPVPVDDIMSTVAELASTPAAMVLTQFYGAMRPGEVRRLKPEQIDRTTSPWLYLPQRHKTQHHGIDRKVWFGPKAQAVLLPMIDRTPPDRFLFLTSGGKMYSNGNYQGIIARAARRAGVPHWSPNQLRHSAATAIRAALGLEAAQAILGHASLAQSQVYAERSEALARKAAAELG